MQAIEVGFSQRIQLEWLQHTAELFLTGNTRGQIQTALQEILRDQLSVGGTAERGNREKAITILLRIWVSVPKHLQALRNDGLELLRRLPPRDHAAVHWGMTMAAYPFFGIVAETVGRLLQLQGSAAALHVQRRVREKLGERETVARAARRVLRCFVDWQVLQETGERGVYYAAPLRSVENPQLAAWLMEAVLLASGTRAMPLHALTQSPALFPFTLGPTHVIAAEVRSRLGVFRQGLDEDMVSIQSVGPTRIRNSELR
jgi:hypothetical protein